MPMIKPIPRLCALILTWMVSLAVARAAEEEKPPRLVPVLKIDQDLDKRTVIKPQVMREVATGIPGAGDGLYAAVTIKEGDVIGMLGGQLRSDEDYPPGNYYLASIPECAWEETKPYKYLDSKHFGAHVSRINFAPNYEAMSNCDIVIEAATEDEAIKRRIDAELAASDAVRERGLAGVPEYLADKIGAADIVLMALGGALVFRSLAFVLAVGFAAGGLHQLMIQSASLTGAPSEFYLAAILAGLIWAAAFWAARALYEGRLKFSA